MKGFFLYVSFRNNMKLQSNRFITGCELFELTYKNGPIDLLAFSRGKISYVFERSIGSMVFDIEDE